MKTHSRIKILNHKLPSKMTQTDNIRTIDNDEDAVKLLDSRKKHDRSVHCKRLFFLPVPVIGLHIQQ